MDCLCYVNGILEKRPFDDGTACRSASDCVTDRKWWALFRRRRSDYSLAAENLKMDSNGFSAPARLIQGRQPG